MTLLTAVRPLGTAEPAVALAAESVALEPLLAARVWEPRGARVDSAEELGEAAGLAGRAAAIMRWKATRSVTMAT